MGWIVERRAQGENLEKVSPRVKLHPELGAAFAFPLARGAKSSEGSNDLRCKNLWGSLISTIFLLSALESRRDTGAWTGRRTPHLGGLKAAARLRADQQVASQGFDMARFMTGDHVRLGCASGCHIWWGCRKHVALKRVHVVCYYAS